MKENSKKSLLLLYKTQKNQKVMGETSKLATILADLQPGGRRAMVAWWQRQGWVESVTLAGSRYLTLTNFGQSTLEQELPYFQIPADWNGEWQLIVLRQAPSHDRAFHSLRQILKREQPLVVARGVYAFVNQVPLAIQQLCQARYVGKVVIISVIADGQNTLNELAIRDFHMYDQINAYSGISKEVNRLLAINNTEKRLINRYKSEYNSLYSRFFATFCEDNGLLPRVIPGSPNPLVILAQIQAPILA